MRLEESRAYLAWGRVERFRHEVARPRTPAEAGTALEACARPALGRGCGRSYGDSCLNQDGLLLDMQGLDRFLAFDPETGVLRAEAGVRLCDILEALARPGPDGAAWFLPVTPGTRYVTLGGAVANDVHGKNHHRFGSFGGHVLGLTLLRRDGRVLDLAPDREGDLFAATIGGLGLTGLILDVTLQLRRVPGLMLVAEDIRFDDLDAFYELSAQSEPGWEYTVAWVDCLAQGKSLGRGLFSRANHVPGPAQVPPLGPPRLGLPLSPPISPLRPLTLRAFNALYWRKLGPRRRRLALQPYPASLYPLDGIGAWNRLYGRAGFYQYQCVLPPAAARDAVAELLRAIGRAGEGSFLAVLKTMGEVPSPGLLSFPTPGTTLALDFPNRGPATLALLDRLDAITMAANGRVYPAKDGRMSGATFRASFPSWERFQAQIDPGFSSSFWRRVMADGPAGAERPSPAEASP